MTPRDLLCQILAQVGIVDAGVAMGYHVIALERMAQGIDPIPEEVKLRLKVLTEKPQPE